MIVQDREIMQAVSRVIQRAERQADIQKVVATFVDVGVLPQLNNQNNQIMYGRRGTGKTHVFRVLSAQLAKEENSTVVYIDARTLGSTNQFSDQTVPIKVRCLSLFRDILLPIYNALLEHIVDRPSSNVEQALDALNELEFSITEPTKVIQENAISTTVSASGNKKSSLGLRLDSKASGELSIGKNVEDSSKKEITTSYHIENQDKVIFPDLYNSLSKTLRLAQTRLYVLIDEWASLPLDIQPFLAEFLKRGFLPIQDATLKIASLEYRSQFALPSLKSLIGFELGADISVALDLDDYFVFDRNPNQIVKAYSDILFNHMRIELPDGYLVSKYGINSGDDLPSKLFTERHTFVELARAAEGVIRDLMYIFNHAFFDATRRGRDSIDRKAIIEAGRKWFEQDKVDQLDDSMQVILRRIVDEVIGHRRARSFMLPRSLEKHAMIQKLFDARVIHHMQRGYADKDNPGARYNIYTLDYGTYVDLIGTSKQPQLMLQEVIDEASDVVVPFDDKRSIRRIILTEEMLNEQV